MPFDHTDYIRSFLMVPGQNGAAKYGVSIVPATVAKGQPYYRVIGIHHLSGDENHGQHNVFCDVLDENGKRIERAVLVAANINHTINHLVIDKPLGEPGTNAPMHFGDTLEFYVTGGPPSDHAKGFHIRHEDEEAGTTRGHHSFYVVWQRTTAGEPDPAPDPDPAPSDWRDDLGPEELWIVNNIDLVAVTVKKMIRLLDEGSVSNRTIG